MPIGDIPIVKRFRLSRHEISQVLCQVQFSPILSLREEEAAIPFQERIRRRYPRYSRTGALSMVIGPQGVQAQQEGPPLHRFEASDGFAVTLAPDFLALETRAYDRFEDVVDRLTELLSTLGEIYEPPEIPRVGLRFVNELRLTSNAGDSALTSVISPELLGPLATEELGPAVNRSEQLLQLAGGDSGNSMFVRHGLFPDGGSTVQSPLAPPDVASLGQPFYLLDIDAFRLETLPFDVEATRDRVLLFNDYIRSFFAWAVPEPYRREVLGQEDFE